MTKARDPYQPAFVGAGLAGLGLRLFHFLRDPSMMHDEVAAVLNVLKHGELVRPAASIALSVARILVPWSPASMVTAADPRERARLAGLGQGRVAQHQDFQRMTVLRVVQEGPPP